MASTRKALYTAVLLLLPHFAESFIIGKGSSSLRFHSLQKHQATVVECENDLRRDILSATTIEDAEELEMNQGKARLVFEGLCQSGTFKEKIWQKRPFLYSTENSVFAPIPLLKDAFTMQDLQEAVTVDFVEAGRGSFEDGRTGWNMAAVSAPKGKSFQEAKMHFEDVTNALNQKNGTVVFNSAGGFIPKVAALCLEAVNAFRLPAAVNMYITNPGQLTSAPPHTDKQDVFVLQSQGKKRWRVYAPPPPKRMLRADPYSRGKGSDVLELSELGEPLIDAILVPGQVLYVPAGHPHTTDTTFIGDAIADAKPSLHLTVGIDTLIWGLTYANLRLLCLSRNGLDDKLLPTKLDTVEYFSLQEALPFGFLTDSIVNEFKGNGPAMRNALYGTIKEKLLLKMRATEPARWEAMTDQQLTEELNMDESITRIITHYGDVTNLFGELYEDVANKISEAQNDLSFFRSQPYFQQLEKIMEGLYQWGVSGKEKIAASKSSKRRPRTDNENGGGFKIGKRQ
jgi:hypothetical protein